MLKITIENITEQDFIEFLNVSNFPNLNDEVNLPCDVIIICGSSKSDKFIENQVFQFFVQSLTAVGINLLSAYIYKKICDKNETAKIKVNNSNVKNDEESINKKLSQEMEAE